MIGIASASRAAARSRNCHCVGHLQDLRRDAWDRRSTHRQWCSPIVIGPRQSGLDAGGGSGSALFAGHHLRHGLSARTGCRIAPVIDGDAELRCAAFALSGLEELDPLRMSAVTSESAGTTGAPQPSVGAVNSRLLLVTGHLEAAPRQGVASASAPSSSHGFRPPLRGIRGIRPLLALCGPVRVTRGHSSRFRVSPGTGGLDHAGLGAGYNESLAEAPLARIWFCSFTTAESTCLPVRLPGSKILWYCPAPCLVGLHCGLCASLSLGLGSGIYLLAKVGGCKDVLMLAPCLVGLHCGLCASLRSRSRQRNLPVGQGWWVQRVF